MRSEFKSRRPEMKKDFCTMYLLRHGETEWNRDKINMGHSDSPLTEPGIWQANELAWLLKSIDFSVVYSSDSPRAVRTARIVFGNRSGSMKKTAKLRERNFFHFEGMSSSEYHKINEESFLAKNVLQEAERWKFKIAGCVESDDSLVMRVISKLQDIATAHNGENVLVSTHGGPIRHLLMKLGYAPYGSLPGGSFKNAGYIVIQSDGKELTIMEVHGIEEKKDEHK